MLGEEPLELIGLGPCPLPIGGCGLCEGDEMDEKAKVVPVEYRSAGFTVSFDNLLAVDAATLEEKKAADAKIEAIKGKLEQALKLKGLASVYNDLWQVTRSAGKAPSRKIDGQRLLEKGVSSLIIKYATIEGAPGRPYVLITARNKNEEAAE